MISQNSSKFLVPIAVLALVSVQFAQAQVTNGGFENSGGSFSGWSLSGDNQIQTSALGTGPVEGTYDALIATATDGSVNSAVVPGTGVDPSTLQSFLGLGGTALAGVGDGSPVIGSAIKQSVLLHAGDKLQFSWDFLTNQVYNDGASFAQAPSTANNDFSFVSLVGSSAGGSSLTKLADTFYGYKLDSSAYGGFDTGFHITAATNPFISETRFQTYSFTVTTTDTYTLGFGSVHNMVGSDDGINSALLVDNIQVQAVPEPRFVFVGLLACGLCFKWKSSRNS